MFRSAAGLLARALRVSVLVSVIVPAVPVAAQSVSYDTAYFRGLSFRNVGPVKGGRSLAVAGSSSRPFEYYFGATGGGVWKTTDGGTTWANVSDGFFTSSSVGAIGQCQANPDVVYVGMGEVAMRGNIMQGDGMYKTTDAGRTWRHIGLKETQAIARVRVHPTNCDLLYVAALGHPYGQNEERGVFRSRDGGTTWERVLFRNTRTGVVDLVMDPANPDVLYAALWQVQRTPWSLESGGTDGGIFKTTNGGTSWTELTKNQGLPQGLWGKVGITVSPVDANRLYAIIEADSGGVFRSDDAGATWTRTSEDRNLRQRAFYYSRIYAHPTEKDEVFVMNVAFHRSSDGGRTFRTVRTPHSDNHDLWIDPTNPQRWINANDGGANVTVNAGTSWTEQDYPTAQLYHITTTNHKPYWVCGAQQDNSTACMQSAGGPPLADNFDVGGGESGYIASDPQNPNIIFAGSYGGLLTRYDAATGQSSRVNVWPDNPMGHSAGDIKERFQWTFPIMFSKTGPKRLYAGSQHLWVTTNEGMSWDRISPDLTRADPKTMGPSGGPITKDQTSVEYYGTIFAIEPSPHDANTIWTGSDDGYVQVTRNHGQTWSNVTPRDMPEFTRVSMIDVSPHRAGAAYVAGKRYQLDDRKPYIWTTEDYGRTWRRIDAGIPDGDYVHVVREDPVRAGLLFAGTENGIWISFDNGTSWSRFNRNLPVTQVPNLMIKGNDLVVATHGRSAWIMDNITPLRQLTPIVAAAPVHLFDPVDPVRGVDGSVAVTYFLKENARTVNIEFVDQSGNVVRTYTAGGNQGGNQPGGGGGGGGFGGGGGAQPSTRAGTNRFTWDLRHPGATTFPGLIMWSAGTNGPRALPGRYTVRLKVDDLPVQTQEFEFRLDPASGVTMADVQAQFELASKVRAATSAANQGVIMVRDVKTQVDDRVSKDASVKQRADALKASLSAVEEELYQVRNRSGQDPLNYPIKLNNRIAALMGAVEGVEGRPTRQSYEVFEVLNAELRTQLTRLQQVITRDLTEFNNFLRTKNLAPIEVKTPVPVT
jgi:photosystem II stability/assembly factor-like uncharacterized protein